MPVSPAASTAATAPSAMVSLPAMMPWMSGSRWSSVSIFVNASSWLQFAVSWATDVRFGYWEMTLA